MAKPKKMNLESLGDFVFSTNPSFDPPSSEHCPTEILNGDQRLEAHFSNKGRGGKTVTIIKNFKGSADALKTLAAALKSKCGVGGSVKDGDIIIQGAFRDKIITLLQKDGYVVKRVGG